MATPNEPDTAYDRPGLRPMPLWKQDLQQTDPVPATADPVPAPAADWSDFEDVLTAYAELNLDAEDVRKALAAYVETLRDTSTQPPAGTPAPTPQPATTPPGDAAAAVETALRKADTHTSALKDLPEWRRIQTVRGALQHVWDVLQTKAGPYWSTLATDIRIQGFWKTASIRACEAISSQAVSLAKRIQGDLPAATALMELSSATITYSTTAAASAPARPLAPPAAAGNPPSSAPVPYAARADAVRAAQDVTTRFQTWIAGPMGQEFLTSSHRRVLGLREAWKQLPPQHTPSAQAVGRYSAVAEKAAALVAAASRSGRFATGDVQALQALAQAAETHAARLAVTLPPNTKAPRTAAAAPQVAVPAQQALRTRRASA
ncbi:hypothetical protein [Streptomyces sp. NPDC047718]|uniref:hypothetical protein n=1 Tax=Streptomyces sp. NPDC047718 TaxID=3155479 RepID=UPI0033C726CB